jgi:hypothetical protein
MMFLAAQPRMRSTSKVEARSIRASRSPRELYVSGTAPASNSATRRTRDASPPPQAPRVVLFQIPHSRGGLALLSRPIRDNQCRIQHRRFTRQVSDAIPTNLPDHDSAATRSISRRIVAGSSGAGSQRASVLCRVVHRDLSTPPRDADKETRHTLGHQNAASRRRRPATDPPYSAPHHRGVRATRDRFGDDALRWLMIALERGFVLFCLRMLPQSLLQAARVQ